MVARRSADGRRRRIRPRPLMVGLGMVIAILLAGNASWMSLNAAAESTTNRDLQFSYTASPSSLTSPGTVTYTYTVTNTSADTRYDFVSISDTGCKSPKRSDGSTNFVLAAGKTHTFTCSQDRSATTTSTANFTYKYYLSTVQSVPVNASLTTTVTGPPAPPGPNPGTTSGPAFECTSPTVYVAHNVSGAETILENQFQYPTGSQFITIGTDGTNRLNVQYNAIAYYKGYIYAVSSRAPGHQYDNEAWLASGHLLQIDANGQARDLGMLSGTVYGNRATKCDKTDGTVGGVCTSDNLGGMTSGAIINGTYFVSNASDSGTKFVYKINLEQVVASLETSTQVTPTITRISDDTKFVANDYTASGGYLWGLQTNATPAAMLRYDPASGTTTTTNLAESVIPGGKTYGAAWTYGNGNLGFSANDGTGVYQITYGSSAANPSFQRVYTMPGPGSFNNDGTSCVANNSVDLSIKKTASTIAPKAGGGVTWYLTITNEGPGVSSGGIVTDPVPKGYTNVNIPDPYKTVCTLAGQQATGQTVTCMTGVLNPGDTYTIPVNATAPTVIGCSDNSASIAGNELDPKSANNSSTVTTCTTNAVLDVSKEAGSSALSGPDAGGDYTVAYTVRVRNSGTAPGTYTQITDLPQFTSAATVKSVAWSGGPGAAGLTNAQPNPNGGYLIGSTAPQTLNQKTTHTYTVVVTFSQAPAATSPLNLCDGTPGNGLFNGVTLPQEDPKLSVDNSACVNPKPAIQIVKDVRLASEPDDEAADTRLVNNGDQVVYVYRVSIPAGYPEPIRNLAVVDDKLGSISNYRSGDTNSDGILQPGEIWLYYSAPTTMVSDVTNVGTVSGTGTVTGTPVTAKDDAHVQVPAFSVEKSAAGGVAGGTGTRVQVNADGTATIDYTVTVRNRGLYDAPHPAITDKLTVPAGFKIVDVKVNDASQGQTASFTIAASTDSVLKNGSKSYSVQVRVNAADLLAVDWTAAGRCNTAGAGRPSDGGFFNQVNMTGDSDGGDNNDACVPVDSPSTTITIQKVGLTCDVGVATCPLSGAGFAIYRTDPSAAGAVPIDGGITPNTGGTSFTSSALLYGQQYWIVETKAPSGHTLLPDPIPFKVDPSGTIVLTNPSQDGAVASASKLVLTIKDPTVGDLPKAGGEGPLPYVAAGFTLLAAAGLTQVRRPGARARRSA